MADDGAQDRDGDGPSAARVAEHLVDGGLGRSAGDDALGLIQRQVPFLGGALRRPRGPGQARVGRKRVAQEHLAAQ